MEVGGAYRSASLDARPSDNGESHDAREPPRHERPGFDLAEHRVVLERLLDELPERERTIVRLRFFEDMTQTEIAEQVGISQMHVSRLLARTLVQLRERLQTLDA